MAAVERYAALAGSSASRWGQALGVTIPLELVLAVMQQENPAADPRLLTHESGRRISRGLMMVLEDTARSLGLDDPMQLHDPATGIDVGVQYLGEQLARYGGSIPTAVAAYNAGSARFTEQEHFVNQAYVDRVLGFLRDFQQGAAAWGPWILGGLVTIVGLYAAYKAAQPRRRRVAA
jgi:soluble lytic murein transglycosylase-like protein